MVKNVQKIYYNLTLNSFKPCTPLIIYDIDKTIIEMLLTQIKA